MRLERAVWIFVIALTAIRFALIATNDLSGDEAHYWMWSQHLAPAYFSKGPGVAFAIRASTAIFGDNEFGVRFWSPILGGLTSLLLFYFARRLFNSTTAFWSVLAMNATPIFNLGNLVMTIDPLSIFFWLAAMFVFWLALEKSASWLWLATGLLIGVGSLCKYTNALQLISIVLVLALVPRHRVEFRRPRFYLLLAVVALCLLPPIVWNADHAWATVSHLRSRGGLESTPGIHPGELLEFLLQHFAIYSPLLFLGLVWAVSASWRRARQQFKILFLFWFGLPIFILYFLLSINETAAPNWDGLAFLSLAILAVEYWRERFVRPAALRFGFGLAFGVAIAMSAVALDTDLLRRVGIHATHRDPADRLRGWKSSTAAIENVRRDLETRLGEKLFVIADERDRASELAFYFADKHPAAPGHPAVYIPESQDIRNQFSFWPRYDEFVAKTAGTPLPPGEVYTEENGENPFVGRSAMFVAAGEKDEAPHSLRAGFASVERVASVEVRRHGKPLREFQIFLCRNYKTLPL